MTRKLFAVVSHHLQKRKRCRLHVQQLPLSFFFFLLIAKYTSKLHTETILKVCTPFRRINGQANMAKEIDTKQKGTKFLTNRQTFYVSGLFVQQLVHTRTCSSLFLILLYRPNEFYSKLE